MQPDPDRSRAYPPEESSEYLSRQSTPTPSLSRIAVPGSRAAGCCVTSGPTSVRVRACLWLWERSSRGTSGADHRFATQPHGSWLEQATEAFWTVASSLAATPGQQLRRRTVRLRGRRQVCEAVQLEQHA